jgi:hypothetical protein
VLVGDTAYANGLNSSAAFGAHFGSFRFVLVTFFVVVTIVPLPTFFSTFALEWQF